MAFWLGYAAGVGVMFCVSMAFHFIRVLRKCDGSRWLDESHDANNCKACRVKFLEYSSESSGDIFSEIREVLEWAGVPMSATPPMMYREAVLHGLSKAAKGEMPAQLAGKWPSPPPPASRVEAPAVTGSEPTP